MGQIQAQDRHLTGTLPAARPTSSPYVPGARVLRLEGGGPLSDDLCLVGVSGGGQGVAKDGEGPGLGGMSAQPLPETGRLGEVTDGLVIASLTGAEPAELIKHHNLLGSVLKGRFVGSELG